MHLTYKYENHKLKGIAIVSNTHYSVHVNLRTEIISRLYRSLVTNFPFFYNTRTQIFSDSVDSTIRPLVRRILTPMRSLISVISFNLVSDIR